MDKLRQKDAGIVFFQPWLVLYKAEKNISVYMEEEFTRKIPFPHELKWIYGKPENKACPWKYFSDFRSDYMNLLPIIAGIVLILLDQGTKVWALQSLKPIKNMTLVEGFMDLTFVENRGVAFGMFSGQRWFILLLTAVITVVLICFYRGLPQKKEYRAVRASIVLILAGAIGNILDRLFRGYVVDFFEFTFFEWPVFNVADIYVVAGVILLAFMILFVIKEEDLELKKKKDE